MIFNSFSFIIFFVIFFTLYWIVFKKSHKLQNLLILVGSCVFYAWTDWRLLSYIIIISVLNYYLGIGIEKAQSEKRKRLYLYIGVIQGLAGLFYFKYFNFFIESFNELFQSLGINFNLQTLSILLPIGISFFTFKTISYLLDINKGKIEATKDLIVFFDYVAFFPTLLSGPIDKAKSFIPQLEKKRNFDYNKATDGLRQILWGLLKKVVIADNIATITNEIFVNSEVYSASTLLLGAFLYTIMLYADFSGYSDMAIGFGRLIGFDVTKNFNFPFFAQNIADFWRKWHISLTSWLTEYVFTPLSISFRDYGRNGTILAILINFTLIGAWHGPNWTFVLFGFVHGCYYIPLILTGKMNKKKKLNNNKFLPSFLQFRNMLGTFILVMLANILFRADNLGHAFQYFTDLFSLSMFTVPKVNLEETKGLMITGFILLMFLIEWLGKENNYAIESLNTKFNRPVRWVFYFLIVLSLFVFTGEEQKYIYFQF